MSQRFVNTKHVFVKLGTFIPEKVPKFSLIPLKVPFNIEVEEGRADTNDGQNFICCQENTTANDAFQMQDVVVCFSTTAVRSKGRLGQARLC